jgi:predicted P-loop ATPase
VIDLAAIARDRDQLWAEAAVAEATGEPLVIPEHLWPEATKQQLERMEIDPWEDILAKKLTAHQDSNTATDGCFIRAADEHGNPEWRVSTSYLLSSLLRIPTERQHNNHTKRLADVMRNLGWVRRDKVMRIGKLVCRGFGKPLVAVLQLSTPTAPLRSISSSVSGHQKAELEAARNVTGVKVFKRRV